MRGDGATFGCGAQRVVECDIEAAAFLAVKKRAGGNRTMQHFFEAERLGAELHGVADIFLGFAAFIFDRKRLPTAGIVRQGAAGRAAVKFDGVGLPAQAEPRG